MNMNIDQILNDFELKVLDIRKAGCVVFHFDDTLDQEKLAFYSERLRAWAKSIGINLLLLPKHLDISVIPREAVTQSAIHTRVDVLEKQLAQLLNCFKPSIEIEDTEPVESTAVPETPEKIIEGVSPNVNVTQLNTEEN